MQRKNTFNENSVSSVIISDGSLLLDRLKNYCGRLRIQFLRNLERALWMKLQNKRERKKKENAGISCELGFVGWNDSTDFSSIQYMKFPQCRATSYNSNCWGGTGACKYVFLPIEVLFWGRFREKHLCLLCFSVVNFSWSACVWQNMGTIPKATYPQL